MFASNVALKAVGAVGVLALLVGTASAQSRPAPRINTVSPMGGQAGTTIELTVTGLDIEEPEGLHFSFPGAKVAQAKVETPPVKGKPDMKKPQPKQGGQSSQKFKVTLPADAPLGIQDVRIITSGGASNPRAFVVGDLKEVAETEPNDDLPKAQKVDMNVTINGLVPVGTDVDYYTFPGKKGQRVILSCLTTSIDSKLPVMLEMFGPTGSTSKYRGSNKGYQGNDALLDVVLPEDGDYYVRLSSFTYTLGGPEYFYRLTISTAPWIDAVFPPVVEAGKKTQVTVYGRNLPGGEKDSLHDADSKYLEKATVTITAPGEDRSGQRLALAGFVPPPQALTNGFGYRLRSDAGSSNTVPVYLARAPIVVEDRDNDSADKAQRVEVPCEIAGMIEKKGDQDWYAFTARKGQVLSIEALGDRLGSPVDLVFELQDEKGTKITRQDENPDTTANQFYTRTDDPPRYRFLAPADGDYRLMVTSQYASSQFGPRHVYALRIAPEQPDFQLVAMGTSVLNPESVTVAQAGNQVYSVLVFREGNFTGDITLSGEDLPAGISVRPQVISANQKLASLVVSAAAEAPPYTGAIRVIGTATVGGKKIVREMRSASITWPVAQPAPTISRLDRELVLAVRGEAPYTLVAEKDKIDILQGDKVTIPVKVNRLSGDFKQPVTVVALNLPPGMVQQQPLTLTPGKDEGKIVLDNKGNALPGNFTLVFRGQTQPVSMKPNPKKVNEPGNLLQASGPVALTIVPKTLGKLSVPANAKVPAGKEISVVVKIARLNEYAGSYKVEMLDAKGLQAEATEIPAGKDEVKLVISAADANPGSNTVVVIRATAMFNDTVPVVHETKLNLAITK